jgi:hypothetical protein
MSIIENQNHCRKSGFMFVLIITFCYSEEIRDVIKRKINAVICLLLCLVLFVCLIVLFMVYSFFVCKSNTSVLTGLSD